MKLLLIEDEPDLLDALRTFLAKEGFLIESAVDFSSAEEKISMYTYDGVLLDLGLPGGSGLDLLKQLKQKDQVCKVIILTAKDALDDKLNGLELGADDYMTKPFHLLELLARIRAVLRRLTPSSSNQLTIGNTTLNLDNRQVEVEGALLHLHKKEYDILEFFMVHPQKLILRTTLAEQVWGDQADLLDNFDFVYSQIKNLRRKLKTAGSDIEIQAVYGVGYKVFGK